MCGARGDQSLSLSLGQRHDCHQPTSQLDSLVGVSRGMLNTSVVMQRCSSSGQVHVCGAVTMALRAMSPSSAAMRSASRLASNTSRRQPLWNHASRLCTHNRSSVAAGGSAHWRLGDGVRFLWSGRGVSDAGKSKPPPSFFDTEEDKSGGTNGGDAFPAPAPTPSTLKKPRTQEAVMEKLDRQR